MEKIEPGIYKAKIKDYGLVQGKSGSPQVKVVFGFEKGFDYSWFGGLGTAVQQEITTKNLLTMGANSQNIEKVELGLSGGVLNVEKIFDIVIEDNTYNGKTTSRIKYINDPSVPRANTSYVKGTGALSILKGQAAQIAAETSVNPAISAKLDDCPGF